MISVPLILIACGGAVVWALAPSKLAELGRLVLLAALIWIVGAFAGRRL